MRCDNPKDCIQCAAEDIQKLREMIVDEYEEWQSPGRHEQNFIALVYACVEVHNIFEAHPELKERYK